MSQTPSETASEKQKPDYRKTLNLPKTSFPMRANLVQNEPASVKRWDKTRLYDRLREERAGRPRFVFHDGPPYANGDIHLGHLLNKCLKDFVVRSHTMMGEDCPYIPGWDCHGLPIEHKVMTELVESGKIEKLATLDDDTRRMAIRKACQASAEKFIKVQAGQMRRLLTMADYDHPYFTMSPAYESATLELFAQMVEQGIVYRQLKSVHWSIANQTALADAELEYMDREDRSVYVDFEAADAAAVYTAFGIGADDHPEQTPCFMIWTTTPWTLPANLAIAVNPDSDYALVRLDGNLTIVAADLVEKVAKIGGSEPAVIATTKGASLIGLDYRHPFIDGAALARELADDGAQPAKLHRIVAGDHVTLEDGCGLVHTAPGHGDEDYTLGLREGLPIYCPVRPDGTYDDTAPDWLRAMSVFDANESVTERLRGSGHLYHDHAYVHSYPHDWRSKTPVIFRATEQWFVGVNMPTKRDGKSLRDTALEWAESKTQFVPAWGRNRLRGMLESRPDWCISRQRSWGLPIPAFFRREADGSDTVLLTPASVRAVARVVEQKGSDAWFQLSPAELLTGYDPAQDPDAPDGLRIDQLQKSYDIFDVWFESGSSWHSAMRQRSDGKDFPVQLYLEGSDQHRGWFQLSMLCGIAATGRPPFEALLTHGFMVDKDGKKMSKSLGNALNVDELMKEFGADVCRWWVATLAYEHDIKVDVEFFRTAGEAYRKVRNTLRFMLSNLGDFVPSPPGRDATCGEGMCVPMHEIPPTSIDAWALGEYDRLSAQVRDALRRYDFREASGAIYDFCNHTLSAVYLAAVKDRLYCDAPDSPRRRRTQSVLWDLADALTRLIAPILPHTADEAHHALHPDDKSAERCVHTLAFVESFNAPRSEAWDALVELRDRALLALEREKKSGGVENPLDAGLVLPDPKGAFAAFDPADVADLMGVSRARFDASATEVAVEDLRDEPRCDRSWKRDGSVRERADGGMLSDRDAEALGV